MFVDGEFWHGKDWEQRKAEIKGNREFWIAKIERTSSGYGKVTGRLGRRRGLGGFTFLSNDVVKNTTCCAEVRQAVRDKQDCQNFKREKIISLSQLTDKSCNLDIS